MLKMAQWHPVLKRLLLEANNIIPTIIILDKLREFYNKPIYILSTYRSPEYNKAVKGKSNSLHLVFNAIDFTIANHKDLLKLYNKLDGWDQTPNMFPFLPKKKEILV